uniref:CC domain-containing protein n=1 Tax=Panagrellus redivivus TaxID=6233 RepID=A0A7E4URF0_PANRE
MMSLIKFALIMSYLNVAFSITVFEVTESPIHHSCKSNEECAMRLNPLYPPYNFVCCTTVSCNDFNAKYYQVTSGCTPSSMCQFGTNTNSGTYFGATMERKKFESYDNSIIGNCDATRQLVGGLPPQNVPVEVEKPITPSPIPAFKEPVCKCLSAEKCCVRVKCIDTIPMTDNTYKVDTICREFCPIFFTKIYEEHTFFFPANDWFRHHEYEKTEGAPSVTTSCRETKYFSQWLTN